MNNLRAEIDKLLDITSQNIDGGADAKKEFKSLSSALLELFDKSVERVTEISPETENELMNGDKYCVYCGSNNITDGEDRGDCNCRLALKDNQEKQRQTWNKIKGGLDE
jgi:hypothetical protein